MPKTPKVQYSKENLQKAIEAVQDVSNNLSTRQIAEKYGVPRSSLRYHIKNPGHKTSLGPSPILTVSEESNLEDWIIISARKGFPRSKEDILDTVQKFLEENPRPNSFLHNRPGDGWWKAFLKRHPKLSIRTSEGVTKASSCVSEKDIRGWFTEIQKYTTEKDLTSILNAPHRIFNADETNFQICVKSGQVLAEKGAKNVYNVEQSQAKESITVLFTFSAAGNVCCPQVTSSVESLVSGATVQLPSPIIVKKKCSLGEFLAYPETPIRKGKRQTERQPYAISSQNFKAALHSKQKEKENLLKVKEDKKLIKEKKKAEKTNAKIKKIDKNSNANTKNENHTLISTSENANSKEIDTTLRKNSQQIIEHSEESLEPISKKIKKEMHIKNKGAEEIRASKKITVLSNIVVQPANFVASPTCGVCHLNVIKNELPCSVCSKIFHVRCIPRKHKEHIPDSSDLHFFLCHLCFKVDDSVSGDSDSSTSAKEIFDIVNKAKRNLF